MAEITAPTYRLRLPDSEEFETVTVAFTAQEAARLKQFVDCAAALLRTSIVRRGFRTTLDLRYADGSLAAEWTRPTDDEMAAYLHRYRPFGLENESTYFYKVVNLLSKKVESRLFRSSLRETLIQVTTADGKSGGVGGFWTAAWASERGGRFALSRCASRGRPPVIW